jgi:Ni2+-binding GTPase involved in maturation of urease and hydrogenase
MKRLRFVLIGGFLGAGKTTTVARLAQHYHQRGLQVGIVTNDQAADLVDTQNLRNQGHAVEEVAGACFCCRFDDLVERMGRLEEANRPDVILAEPVGSCTDLVATIVQPMRDLYGSRFDIAPYAVLFKPSHGLKILRGEPAGGFSPKAAYIFEKQLEEADAIVLNRLDELNPEQIEELTQLVRQRFPGTPLVPLSAKTGQGFEGLTHLLDQEGAFGRKILQIDYDTYAEGEAELGWLNAGYRLESETLMDLDQLLLGVVVGIQSALGTQAEVAHLKAIGLSEGLFGVANLVASGMEPELSLPSREQTSVLDLIVNARVAIAPEELEAIVRATVPAVASAHAATAHPVSMQSFRPGRPVPTHRYSEAH